jgi:hypothetical protein
MNGLEITPVRAACVSKRANPARHGVATARCLCRGFVLGFLVLGFPSSDPERAVLIEDLQ